MSTDPKNATTVDATPITLAIDLATPSTESTPDVARSTGVVVEPLTDELTPAAPVEPWGAPGTWGEHDGQWGGPAPDPEPEAA